MDLSATVQWVSSEMKRLNKLETTCVVCSRTSNIIYCTMNTRATSYGATLITSPLDRGVRTSNDREPREPELGSVGIVKGIYQ